MKLTPKIEVVESIKDEKQQKEKASIIGSGKVRTNNRKRTRARSHIQIIWYQDGSTFPPVLRKKIIKHL
jgi:hypothetical protein